MGMGKRIALAFQSLGVIGKLVLSDLLLSRRHGMDGGDMLRGWNER